MRSEPRGKSGIEISELFPHVAEMADDLCVIRSMKNDHGDHFEATLGIHTGSVTFTRPSIGSWVSYGLGTENQNLPSFVVLAPELPYAGGQVWGSDFLPGCHQGTRIVPGSEPIPNIARRGVSPEVQQMELGLLDFFNRRHLAGRAGDAALAARVKSFETAYGMQQEALRYLYALEDDILRTGNEALIGDWRRLQTSDHAYYMCTKWFHDGDVHAYFSPYESPYDAFLYFMNALRDLRYRLMAYRHHGAIRV